MKHPLTVAVHNGFTVALATEVQEGRMPLEQAQQIGRFAMAVSIEYLKGNQIFFKDLGYFAKDGEMFDSVLRANKINLAKYGD